MLIIQNRIKATTPDEAIAKIYEKHNPIQPPRIRAVMECAGGIWYEYITEIEELV